MRRDRVESREGREQRGRLPRERGKEGSEGGETLLVSFTFRELCNALTLIRNLFLACLPAWGRKCTGLGKRVGPRLRVLASRGQRQSGGGIHAT